MWWEIYLFFVKNCLNYNSEKYVLSGDFVGVAVVLTKSNF